MREIDWREVTEERDIRIRTRGAIRTRGGIPTAIRTRGGIRTRGAVSTEEKSLEELVNGLREKANGSYIAVLIHGWDEQPVQAFLRKISPLLDVDDAIWLVPSNGTEPTAPPELPEAVVLDFSRDQDKRTYDCLVVDIAFFHNGGAEAVEKWKRRVETVIIASAEQYVEMVDKARQNGQDIYNWPDQESDKLIRI